MVKHRANGWALWERSIRRGTVSFVRERDWLTALGALTGVFLLLQLMILVLLGTEEIQMNLRSQTNLTLEILEQSSAQDTQEFLSALQQQPYVKKVTYITKEQAFAQMKEQDPELILFLEEFALQNPFPETAIVSLHSLQNYALLNTFIKQERWRSVVNPAFLSSTTNQEKYVYELLHITGIGRAIVLFFLVLTVLVSVFITTELVRERVLKRSEEVLVEHLSGTYTFSILLPFAVEASLLLCISFVASLLLIGITILILPFFTSALANYPSVNEIIVALQTSLLWKTPYIIGIELLAIPVIGWIGTWLGTLSKIDPRKLVLYRQ